MSWLLTELMPKGVVFSFLSAVHTKSKGGLKMRECLGCAVQPDGRSCMLWDLFLVKPAFSWYWSASVQNRPAE